MTVWFRQHLFGLKSALAHLRASPGNFLFNVLVVAIALALPIAGLTLIENIRPISTQLSIEPEISVFLTPDTPRADAIALALPIKKLLKDANVSAKLTFVTKDKALAAMEETSSLAEVLSTLGGNPLPDAYVLSLSNSDANRVEFLTVQLKSLPGVDVVQVDSAWVKRLAALVQVLQLSLLFLAVTLSVVVIVVIFNATRLQVISHQAEIAIARLLGATNSFIHRPYYYTGALLGLLAGCAALALIAVSLRPLNQAIAEFAKLYASEFHLVPLGLLASLALLATSVVLGLFGAFLSVRRQLARAS
ncbi:permease-like cell division protein FtsX [Undibacterium sp. RTI2.1]|uniref:cell division protein FtsX n=1 Tax=unclassified Undibacterium TaxID=2630295 RepID=UPI002AB3CFAA|nr:MULTISPECIES: permease-like cell division protein FtsX [unclassified Undibacterium]MDY7540098.1 permease-like cell division protein FtsX [Undibacterium sp. 5I1]MEB0031711.1 permease-like cell division protein FtsX [Undibacterium sp. RTI2.1]MEB0118037.1 permease-like cell division protein FtsX [Undibacterium sp. RTI2.2]MEB0231791.1 permease-like cell division protein FtsX [Undibacterium sp. 10I3]MEB0259200.1 permease-like cell division protein FtsX [Undibacterium sp. 5I1]